MLISPRKLLRRPASIYLTIIRNTPLLVRWCWLTYFALPQVGIRMSKVEGFIATPGVLLRRIPRQRGAGLLAV